jgi:hypothetical protein
VGKEDTKPKSIMKEQKKFCPLCRWMAADPWPKYNVKDRLLKMEEKIDA